VSTIRSLLIVEDNRDQRNYLVESALKFNSGITIHSTDKRSEAIKIVNQEDIGAFFIDIQLLDGSGIELAKEIRTIKKYQFTPIVFITGMRTKELEAFHDVHCYDYILKPYTKKTITDVMSKIMIDYFDQLNEEPNYLTLDFKGLKQRVNLKDILLVESRSRRIIIWTQYEEIKYKSMNLSQFAKELPAHFIQTHQSFLVNREYIEKVDMISNCIFLKGLKDNIPIGTSYKKKVGEQI
jgi:two-component system LytT family response regulator